MTRSTKTDLLKILNELFPEVDQGLPMFAADSLARAAESVRENRGLEPDTARAKRHRKAFTSAARDFDELAKKTENLREETEGVVRKLESEPGALDLLFSNLQRFPDRLSTLDQVSHYFVTMGKGCTIAALWDCPKPRRGAPRKHECQMLALKIVSWWRSMTAPWPPDPAHVTLPLPLPQGSRSKPFAAMTIRQKMGALCQTLGELAELPVYENTIPAWQARLKRADSSL